MNISRSSRRRSNRGIAFFAVLLIVVVVSAVSVGGTMLYERNYGETARLRRETAALNTQRDQANQRTIVLQGERDDVMRQAAQVQAQLDAERVQYRVAVIEVVDQQDSTQYPGQKETTVRYQETDSRGNRLGNAEFIKLLGTRLYMHGQVVRFPEVNPLTSGLPAELSGRSLFLTRGLYTERYAPRDGFPLNPLGIGPHGRDSALALPNLRLPGTGTTQPTTPRGTTEDVYRRFWDIANDPARARELGVNVRDAFGQGVFVDTQLGRDGLPLGVGRRYSINLQHSDGLTMRSDSIPADELARIRAQIPRDLRIHPVTGTSNPMFQVPPENMPVFRSQPIVGPPAPRATPTPAPQARNAPRAQNAPAVDSLPGESMVTASSGGDGSANPVDLSGDLHITE